MNEGKARVIGEVLKQQGVFKAARITQATGLARQLVYHHLTQLTEDGFLEKDGMLYGVVARQELIDSLVNINEKDVVGLLPAKVMLNYDDINRAAEISLNLTAAGLEGHLKLRQKLIEDTDLVIRRFKAFKRYMNSKTISKKKALRFIEKNFDEVWGVYRKIADIDREQFEAELLKLEKEG